MIAVIGDIHGCYFTFRKLLNSLFFSYEIEKFIFIGDLIDRGKHSKEVIHEIMNLSKNFEVILILGNHEDMMFDYIYSEKRYGDRVWFENGGFKTVKSFSESLYNSIFWRFDEISEELKILMEEELKFLKSSKLYYIFEIKNFNKKLFFSHAGIQFQNISPFNQLDVVTDPFEKDIKFPYLWSREIDYFSTKIEDFIFIHGHTPVQMLKRGDRKNPYINRDNSGEIISINIDTGCVYGGFLTAMIFDEDFQFEFVMERYSG